MKEDFGQFQQQQPCSAAPNKVTTTSESAGLKYESTHVQTEDVQQPSLFTEKSECPFGQQPTSSPHGSCTGTETDLPPLTSALQGLSVIPPFNSKLLSMVFHLVTLCLAECLT